jgi:hypothetical protein
MMMMKYSVGEQLAWNKINLIQNISPLHCLRDSKTAFHIHWLPLYYVPQHNREVGSW